MGLDLRACGLRANACRLRSGLSRADWADPYWTIGSSSSETSMKPALPRGRKDLQRFAFFAPHRYLKFSDIEDAMLEQHKGDNSSVFVCDVETR